MQCRTMFSLKLIVTGFLLLCYVSNVENANILFVTISPSASHQIVFQAVWKELSLRGHKVTVITPMPLKDPSLTNLTEIQVEVDLTKMVSAENAAYLLKKPDFLTVFLKDSIMTKFYSKFMEASLANTNMQRFLSEEHHFDLAIIEWLYPTMAAFGAKYNCPIIGISSLGAPIVAMDTVGNPSHPIIAPDHNLPIGHDLVFRERLMSSLYAVYVRLYYHWVILPREDALVKKYLGQDLPYLGDIERNVSLLLLNRNPLIHRIIPLLPTVIETGGIQLNKTKKELEPSLKEFLDKSKNGAIYFSLGSFIQPSMAPKNFFETIFKVFGNLPYNVVVKYGEGTMPKKPDNVFGQKWLPQVELLNHPNLKLFIYQGGLQSTEDAIKAHVPVIGMPFQADQTTNVNTCVNHGMGIMIDIEDVTAERLTEAIHKIMNDPNYMKNAAKLDQLVHDLPEDGLEKAVWWTEYVIRHKGAKHLRSHAMDISWIEYLLLDVIALLLLVLSLVIYISCKIIRLIFQGANLLLCSKKCNAGKADSTKKKQ